MWTPPTLAITSNECTTPVTEVTELHIHDQRARTPGYSASPYNEYDHSTIGTDSENMSEEGLERMFTLEGAVVEEAESRVYGYGYENEVDDEHWNDYPILASLQPPTSPVELATPPANCYNHFDYETSTEYFLPESESDSPLLRDSPIIDPFDDDAQEPEQDLELPQAEVAQYPLLTEEVMDLPEEDYAPLDEDVAIPPIHSHYSHNQCLHSVPSSLRRNAIIANAIKTAGGKPSPLPPQQRPRYVITPEDEKIIDYCRPHRYYLISRFMREYPDGEEEEFIRFLYVAAVEMKQKELDEDWRILDMLRPQFDDLYALCEETLSEEHAADEVEGGDRFIHFLRDHVRKMKERVFVELVTPFLEAEEGGRMIGTDEMQTFIAEYVEREEEENRRLREGGIPALREQFDEEYPGGSDEEWYAYIEGH